MRWPMLLIRSIVTGALLASPGASAHAQESVTTPPSLIDEPSIIERAVISVDRTFGNAELTNGFYWDVWNMIPGAGWISAGPGYHRVSDAAAWITRDRHRNDRCFWYNRFERGLRHSYRAFERRL